ncbi:hypothetical protein Y695_01142 [Hydrogenophaga sp. T4]|nr:hypothetical protein Y695_01142 [Hydrogenophaga sp. T4]
MAGRFACGLAAVVTAGTVGGRIETAVIDLGARPAGCAVTGRAVGAGRDVNGRLAAGLSSVVAAGTVGGRVESAVIDLGARPAGRAVTGRAVGTGCNVNGRLAAGLSSVVAAGTAGGRVETAVIDLGPRPTAGAVAAVARLAGWHRDVAGTFSGRLFAVVTAGTGTGRHTRMVKLGGWQPGGCSMARVTRSLGGQVITGLAGRRCAVVTGGASACDHGGVTELGPRKRLCGVAGVTGFGGRNVPGRHDQVVLRQPCATGVTAGAVLGRSLENPPHMTGFAACRRVLTAQCKTGFGVVKAGFSVLRPGARTPQHQHKYRQALKPQAREAPQRQHGCFMCVLSMCRPSLTPWFVQTGCCNPMRESGLSATPATAFAHPAPCGW